MRRASAGASPGPGVSSPCGGYARAGGGPVDVVEALELPGSDTEDSCKRVMQKLRSFIWAKLSVSSFVAPPCPRASVQRKSHSSEWALRDTGQRPRGVARAVFCIAIREEIVILMTVFKKSGQIPKRLLDAAQRRMKEVRSDE